ncbi:MAG: acetyl-CoA hydrolase/transferase C-terminal domain-containing protein [Oscillospiraceae bacterium]|nr:acetyl-CoA hydrolase/transferase C-terminal domain-containing protein [Oscillospiraceae bacterium]
MSAEKAASFIKSGMTIGMSGFSTGAPKVIPLEILKPGTVRDLTVIQGAGIGMLDELTDSGAVSRYAAFQWSRKMHDSINKGNISFTDIHLGQLSGKISNGVFGKMDYAIVECSAINKDGGIVPSISVGITNTLLEYAERVLLEVNLSVPSEIEGMHDIYKNDFIPLKGILERKGETVFRCDPEKIAGIVITNDSEPKLSFRDTNEVYQFIAKNVLTLLNAEISSGRLPRGFTLQAGVGGVANAVLQGLSEGGYSGLKMFTEVLADGALGFILKGVIAEASTTTLDLSPAGLETFFANTEFFKKRIVLRPLEVSNGPAQISAMGLVAMNTAVEADIYGNINSTNALGTKMLNGIGGSNDFCRSAALSIFITPSTAKNGLISSIVPMVPHVDSTEHDVDVIATEYGYADLRGKSPKERVREIIDNCAHPDYRQQLWDYYNGALSLCGPTQTPHDLSKALSWHQRFLKTGSMKI